MLLENGYLETFARDNVTLVDLIIYAIGFDAGVGAINKIDIRGVDGVTPRDRWARSLTTTVGMLVHGFPNLFVAMAPFAQTGAQRMAHHETVSEPPCSIRAKTGANPGGRVAAS